MKHFPLPFLAIFASVCPIFSSSANAETLSITTGSERGGQVVLIDGIVFEANKTYVVKFGNNLATNVQLVGRATLGMISPAGTGTVPVTFQALNSGQGARSAGQFNYVPVPAPPPAASTDTFIQRGRTLTTTEKTQLIVTFAPGEGTFAAPFANSNFNTLLDCIGSIYPRLNLFIEVSQPETGILYRFPFGNRMAAAAGGSGNLARLFSGRFVDLPVSKNFPVTVKAGVRYFEPNLNGLGQPGQAYLLWPNKAEGQLTLNLATSSDRSADGREHYVRFKVAASRGGFCSNAYLPLGDGAYPISRLYCGIRTGQVMDGEGTVTSDSISDNYQCRLSLVRFQQGAVAESKEYSCTVTPDRGQTCEVNIPASDVGLSQSANVLVVQRLSPFKRYNVDEFGPTETFFGGDANIFPSSSFPLGNYAYRSDGFVSELDRRAITDRVSASMPGSTPAEIATAAEDAAFYCAIGVSPAAQCPVAASFNHLLVRPR